MAQEIDIHPKGWRGGGQWILLGVVLASVMLWLIAQTSFSYIIENPLLSLSKLCGVVGLTMYSLNVMLSTRLRVYEKLFAGLNNLYRVHHTMGGLAFIFMLSHPLFLFLSKWSYPSLIRSYLVPSESSIKLGYTAGSLALWMIILLLCITYWVKLPYQWWKRTHYFMGFPAFFMMIHILLVPSDVQRYPILKWWLFALLMLAAFARVYKFVWLRYIRRGYSYKVCEIERKGTITEIKAIPKSKAMQYLPGQFAFVTFTAKNLPREEHPFSISNYEENGMVRFSIKNSGDFTGKLSLLHRSDLLYIQGPFGIFAHSVYETTHDLVMVAGGIGITPFMSSLQWLVKNQPKRKVTLYYSVRDRKEAVYETELKAIKAKMRNLQIAIIETEKSGMLSGEKIIKHQKTTDSSTKYLLCGPPGMQRAITTQLQELGVPARNIETELFSL